ncbi:MAG: hypothetical protein ACRD4Y_05540 [Candidatus Acidiferrales bacterium]
MSTNHTLEIKDVERREFQLTLFACCTIVALAAGLALLMYPAVFANKIETTNRTPQVAFFGFCGLSSLLVAYIVDRQFMIRGLQRQIAADRRRNSDALKEASADLLATMANFNSFQDRLSMEFRRAHVAGQTFSMLVVAVKLHPRFSDQDLATSALGDAAKAISRKLRGQDSIYLLKAGFFGVILPGIDTRTARRICHRLSEGLSDAAGANDRFYFEIETINYPEHATSAHDLELAVRLYLPEDGSGNEAMKEIHVSN